MRHERSVILRFGVLGVLAHRFWSREASRHLSTAVPDNRP